MSFSIFEALKLVVCIEKKKHVIDFPLWCHWIKIRNQLLSKGQSISLKKKSFIAFLLNSIWILENVKIFSEKKHDSLFCLYMGLWILDKYNLDLNSLITGVFVIYHAIPMSWQLLPWFFIKNIFWQLKRIICTRLFTF